MRAIAGVLILMAAFTGCEKASPPRHRSVKVHLNPVNKSIGVTGASSSVNDPWPYGMSALGSTSPREWIGMAITKGGGPKVIEIRCTEAGGESVKVTVSFSEAFDPNLASLAFDHLGKVDQVVDGGGKPYSDYTRDGENFELRAPKSAARITFLAWPHVH